jgi:hypothetical protein
MCTSEINYLFDLNCEKYENITIANTVSGKTLKTLKYEVWKMFWIIAQYCCCVN